MELKSKGGGFSLAIEVIAGIILVLVVITGVEYFSEKYWDKSTEKLGEMVESVEVKLEPSAEKPITIPTVVIGVNKTKTYFVGFYCLQSGGCEKAKPKIIYCTEETKLQLSALEIDVGAGEIDYFKVLLNSGKTSEGSYICIIGVGSEEEPGKFGEIQSVIEVTE